MRLRRSQRWCWVLGVRCWVLGKAPLCWKPPKTQNPTPNTHPEGLVLSEHIFFVGIAGIGVSALAQVAQARGAKVSGSDPHADPQSHPAIARLLAGGARIYREHRP